MMITLPKSMLLLSGLVLSSSSSSSSASASQNMRSRGLQTAAPDTTAPPSVTPLPPPETTCYQNVMLNGKLQLQLLNPCPTAGSCVAPSGCSASEQDAFVDGNDARCKSDMFLVLQHVVGYTACEWQYICCTFAAPSPAPTPLV